MIFKKIKDLPIWQEGRNLANEIYGITLKIQFKDFSLRDQMRRCSISFISNVAEGFERGSNKEFIQFLYIVKGSMGELRAQIYLAHDINFIVKDDFLKLMNKCLNLSTNTANFIKYLRNSDITKLRYKLK